MNIGAHAGAIIAAAVASSSLLTGFVLHLLGAKLPAFVQYEEKLWLDQGLAKLTRPEDKAAAKAVLAAIRARFPEAEASVYTQAADAVIKECPALTPYRADLVTLFQGIESAAAQGLDAEIKP